MSRANLKEIAPDEKDRVPPPRDCRRSERL
jgi:hypothetical protein